MKMKNLMFLAAVAKPMKPERERLTGLARKSWIGPVNLTRRIAHRDKSMLRRRRPRTRYGVVLAKGLLCLSLMALVLVAPARADVMITLAGGVTNPPPPLTTTGLTLPQTAIADTATLVPVAEFTGVLQSTLNAQGFTAANNWTLVDNQLTLTNNATFNITAYSLSLNAAGTAFGETMDFTLNPNLAAPVNPPAGSTVTEHWLQILNEDQQYGGFGYAITGQEGFWQLDNGDFAGGAAAGAATGPYYDSHSPPGSFSVPPTFHDFPQYYSGVGTYLHFTVIPIWDVYTPAMGDTLASESICVGNYGVAWGFSIVPEPASLILAVIGLGTVVSVLHRRRALR